MTTPAVTTATPLTFVCPACKAETPPTELLSWWRAYADEVWHETCQGCGITIVATLQLETYTHTGASP